MLYTVTSLASAPGAPSLLHVSDSVLEKRTWTSLVFRIEQALPKALTIQTNVNIKQIRPYTCTFKQKTNKYMYNTCI